MEYVVEEKDKSKENRDRGYTYNDRVSMPFRFHAITDLQLGQIEWEPLNPNKKIEPSQQDKRGLFRLPKQKAEPLLTLGIVDISEMQKCGLKYDMSSPRKCIKSCNS